MVRNGRICFGWREELYTNVTDPNTAGQSPPQIRRCGTIVHILGPLNATQDNHLMWQLGRGVKSNVAAIHLQCRLLHCSGATLASLSDQASMVCTLLLTPQHWPLKGWLVLHGFNSV